MNVDRPSSLAQRLGYAGLLPFGFGALMVWLVGPEALPYAALGLAAWAAVIVSFLGALHWGAVMMQTPADGQSNAPLSWGVVPPFVAALAVLMPPNAGLVILGAMLVLCYLVDRRLYPAMGLGGWLTLRFRLSAVAALCCFLGAAGT